MQVYANPKSKTIATEEYYWALKEEEKLSWLDEIKEVEIPQPKASTKKVDINLNDSW